MKAAIILAFLIAGCSGFQHGNIDKQIVNGYEAGSCEFPHMAYLLLEMKDGSHTTCGGSLIDSVHILTASHCVKDIVGVTAHLGHANNRQSPQVIEGARWAYHRGYSKVGSVVNDVAMIRLEKPAKLGRCVKTISLPSKDEVFTGYCTAAGWGRTSNTQYGPAHMRTTRIKVIPTQECKTVARNISKKQHICVGSRYRMASNICNGDSGGPLMCKSGNKLVVAGVASYVYNCEKGFGVYANVAGLLDWVKKIQNLL